MIYRQERYSSESFQSCTCAQQPEYDVDKELQLSDTSTCTSIFSNRDNHDSHNATISIRDNAAQLHPSV